MSTLCTRCRGSGTIKVSNGMDYDRHPCPECQGSGDMNASQAMVLACIIQVLREAGRPMSLDGVYGVELGLHEEVRQALAPLCLTEDQFMKAIRIHTGNGIVRFNNSALLELRNPPTPKAPPHGMTQDEAEEMFVRELRGLLYYNITNAALADPRHMTGADIIWGQPLFNHISAIANAMLTAFPDKWTTLSRTKVLVDKAYKDLDVEWLEAPLTAEENERAERAATSPTYDMDTLKPSEKEPEMIVRCLFSQGDVVYLKSGGPAMTVSSQASESGMVRTRWFVFQQGVWGNPESGEFAQDSLTKDPPGENVSELKQAATDAFLALVPLCLRGKEAGRPATIRLANILGIDWQRMSIPSDEDDTSCCR